MLAISAHFTGCTALHKMSDDLSHDMTKETKWVCAQQRQISLGIRPVWSESSLCAQWVAKTPSFLHADSEDWSAGMTRLIWVFAGRTCHSVLAVQLFIKCLMIWATTWQKCPGWSESSPGAHIFYWFCHVVAHLLNLFMCYLWFRRTTHRLSEGPQRLPIDKFLTVKAHHIWASSQENMFSRFATK